MPKKGGVIKEFPGTVSKHSIKVSYVNHDAVDALLGSQGKHVLEKVVNLVRNITQEEKWPLHKVGISLVKDPEITDWEYVLVLLCFDCDFKAADEYLHDFYKKLDVFVEKLDGEGQEIIQRMIYFDVQSIVPKGLKLKTI